MTEYSILNDMEVTKNYLPPQCEALEVNVNVICGSADPILLGFDPETDWDA